MSAKQTTDKSKLMLICAVALACAAMLIDKYIIKSGYLKVGAFIILGIQSLICSVLHRLSKGRLRFVYIVATVICAFIFSFGGKWLIGALAASSLELSAALYAAGFSCLMIYSVFAFLLWNSAARIRLSYLNLAGVALTDCSPKNVLVLNDVPCRLCQKMENKGIKYAYLVNETNPFDYFIGRYNEEGELCGIEDENEFAFMKKRFEEYFISLVQEKASEKKTADKAE